jgi:formate dehydrogenase iron-sulfur subunit
MNQLRSTIVKCDLCVDRMDAGKVPACVEACHTNALYFQSDEDAEAIIGEPAWMKPGGVTEGGDRS